MLHPEGHQPRTRIMTPTRESRESTPLCPINLETPQHPPMDTPAPAIDATIENDMPTLDKSLPLVVNRFEKKVINMLTKLNAKIDALSRRQNSVENIVTELKKDSDRWVAQREDVPVSLSQRDASSSENTSSIERRIFRPNIWSRRKRCGTSGRMGCLEFR